MPIVEPTKRPKARLERKKGMLSEVRYCSKYSSNKG